MAKIKILLIAILLFLEIDCVYASKLEEVQDLERESISLIEKNNNPKIITNVINQVKNNVIKNKVLILLVCLIPGVITSAIVFFVYYFRNQMIRRSFYASDYLVENSVNITDRQKIYRGSHTSKSKKLNK